MVRSKWVVEFGPNATLNLWKCGATKVSFQRKFIDLNSPKNFEWSVALLRRISVQNISKYHDPLNIPLITGGGGRNSYILTGSFSLLSYGLFKKFGRFKSVISLRKESLGCRRAVRVIKSLPMSFPYKWFGSAWATAMIFPWRRRLFCFFFFATNIRTVIALF